MSRNRSSAYEDLKGWISQLPGVTEASHKLGGTEFRVNGVEFMHSHGSSRLDIRLSKEDQASALKAGQALSHRASVHAQAGWVTVGIQNAQDLVKARSVLLLAYENAKKETSLK
jgi:luciferase-like monooxygenase